MAPRPHILVVNGRKVRQPVFIIGAPHSGVDLLARALKSSPGFHVTIGQRSVMSVVYAFARSPSIQRGRGEAAATVLRDAFAQAWQVTAHGCLGCSPACRDAGGVNGAGSCVAERDIGRYGGRDPGPDVLRRGPGLTRSRTRGSCRSSATAGTWWPRCSPTPTRWPGSSPGVVNVDSEFPNPFFGIETEADLAAWPGLSLAGRCAMRWRGSVRTMARLRTSLPAERLTTLRYEEMLRQPAAAARAVSGFIGAEVAAIGRARGRGAVGSLAVPSGGWRRALTPQQVTDVEQVAGIDLRRVGYGA